MSASSYSAPAPSLARAALALLVTLLVLGGALLGAALLATGALLTLGMRALGIGRRQPTVSVHRPQPAPGILEGEYRVVKPPAP